MRGLLSTAVVILLSLSLCARGGFSDVNCERNEYFDLGLDLCVPCIYRDCLANAYTRKECHVYCGRDRNVPEPKRINTRTTPSTSPEPEYNHPAEHEGGINNDTIAKLDDGGPNEIQKEPAYIEAPLFGDVKAVEEREGKLGQSAIIYVLVAVGLLVAILVVVTSVLIYRCIRTKPRPFDPESLDEEQLTQLLQKKQFERQYSASTSTGSNTSAPETGCCVGIVGGGGGNSSGKGMAGSQYMTNIAASQNSLKALKPGQECEKLPKISEHGINLV